MKGYARKLIPLILLIHASLLVYSAWVHSPLVDEPAHLSAGLSHWKKFSFDLYRVNPPLVRMIAALPIMFVQHNEDWSSYSDDLYRRAEFQVGADFIKANPGQYRFLLFLARCFCIPLSVLGGYICYRFSKELFSPTAGILALILWCFSPMILAFGYVIMPDVGSAALGIAALYCYYHWFRFPSWYKSYYAGFILGLAQLTKFTLLTLYPVMFFIWGCQIVIMRKRITRSDFFLQLRQLMTIFLMSIVIIHFGYGFEGSLIPLKDFEFVSRTMCGETKWNHETGFTATGNRFRDTLLGYVPVPVPANYLLGIDVQKKDFEIGRDSYFWGEWSREGWYSYYVLGLLIKEPLGLWILLLLVCICVIFIKSYRTNTCSEMLLIAPVIIVLFLVSSQTNLNHHLRYAFPIFPFLFIFVSRLGKYDKKRSIVFVVSCSLTVWFTLSSLCFFPHSQAYFNGLIGSPAHAPKYLLGSNIDWGQNLFYLEQWCKEHSEVSAIYVADSGSYPPENTAIPHKGMSPTNDPPLGWYALSVNYLYDQTKQYRYFLNEEPIARVGYSIYIYHITLDDADVTDPRK